MAILSGDAFKRKRLPFPITIGLMPDREPAEVLIMRPDIRRLVYEGALPVPLLSKINHMLATWAGKDLSTLDDTAQPINGTDALEELNRMFCLCMVQPRAFHTDDDAVAAGVSDYVLASDIDVDTKERIVIRALATDPLSVNRGERDSAARFSGVGPSTGTAPDVPGVQSAPVSGVTD